MRASVRAGACVCVHDRAPTCISSAWVREVTVMRASFVEPKSISTGWSPSLSSTFAGLMSRCAHGGSCSWKAATPSSSAAKIWRQVRSFMRVPSAMCLSARSSSVPRGYSGISSRNSSAPLAVGAAHESRSGIRFLCLNALCTSISHLASADCSSSCASTFFSAYLLPFSSTR